MTKLENPPTVRAIDQAIVVDQLLADGLTNRAIAEKLGISNARVSQIRTSMWRFEPYLEMYPEPTERLRSIRDQLRELRHDALHLAVALRRELHRVEDEIDGIAIDDALDLSPY